MAIDEAAGRRRIYTIDDSSGKCIEALVKMSPPTTLNDAPRRMQARAGAAAGGAAEPSAPDSDSLGPYGHIDVGDVVDVKGALSTFREKAQINVEKIVIVKGTAQEVKLWEKRTKFRQEVLDRPWILSDKEIRRCRKEAEASDARLGKKNKHLKAISDGGTGTKQGTVRPLTTRTKDGLARAKADAKPKRDAAERVKELIRGGSAAGKYSALGL